MSKTFLNIILAATKFLIFNSFFKNTLIYFRDVQCSMERNIDTTEKDKKEDFDGHISIMNDDKNIRLLNHLWNCQSCKGTKNTIKINVLINNEAICSICHTKIYNKFKEEGKDPLVQKEYKPVYSIEYDAEKKTIILGESGLYTFNTLQKIYHSKVEWLDYKVHKKMILPEYIPSYDIYIEVDLPFKVNLSDDAAWKTCLELFQNAVEKPEIEEYDEETSSLFRNKSIEDLEYEKITFICLSGFTSHIDTVIQLFKIIFDKNFFDNSKKKENKNEVKEKKLRMFLDIIENMHRNYDRLQVGASVKCMKTWTELPRSENHENLVCPFTSSSRRILSIKKTIDLKTPLAFPTSYGEYNTVESFMMDSLDIFQSSEVIGDFIRKNLFIKFEMKNEQNNEIFYESIIDLDFKLTKKEKKKFNKLEKEVSAKIKAKLDAKLQGIFSDKISESIELFSKNFKTSTTAENISWEFAEYLLLRPILGLYSKSYMLPERIELLDINKNKVLFEKVGSVVIDFVDPDSPHPFFRRKGICIDDEEIELIVRIRPKEKEALLLYKRVVIKKD